MNKYLNQVVNMDCLEVMKELPDNSIDLICTDPPYQLSSTTKKRTDDIAVKGNDGKSNPYCRQQAQKGFMGKEWDVMPSVEKWVECLRVLKPGAFAFICMTPRQDSMALAINRIQEAGFQTGFTSIYWTYASGFPKASNIGMLIDKQECKKQLVEKLGRQPTKEEFKKEWDGFREIIGKKQCGYQVSISKKRKEEGYRPNLTNATEGVTITKPTSEQAKSLDGSYGGFQPKPAVEIILVVMKPLSEKTYVDQAMNNKKGITWLDDGRIPISAEDRHEYGIDGNEGNPTVNCYGQHDRVSYQQDSKGRFPANLLVSDDVLDDGKVSKSTSDKKSYLGKDGTSTFVDKQVDREQRGDSGSFSRYFSLDAWFKKKLKDLSPAVQKVFPFLIVPKASKSEKNEGLDKLPDKIMNRCEPRPNETGWRKERMGKVIRKNIHPTCKPIKLMSYLITIGSREKDIILDPFAGSCTTGVACIGLNRQFIMCEKEKEYFEIGKARLDYAKSQLKLL